MAYKIAIQGGKASFHDFAAKDYFSQDIESIECKEFRDLCEKVKAGDVDYGIMAIENSIAGSILPNYSLIKEYQLNVVGEYKERIKLNLMALPGETPQSIKRVMSHYMALLQCSDFLNQFPDIELEKFYDTADSAKEIKRKGLNGVAAIASSAAAQLYGLDILADDIETIKQNYTRFLVLSPRKEFDYENANKATLRFELPDKVGALARSIQIVMENRINMTKIQSLPIIGKPEEYTFYIDCEWNNYDAFNECVKQLDKYVHELNVFGIYKKWEISYDH